MRILLLILMLSACSTSTPDIVEKLNVMVGTSQDNLIDNWGFPDENFTVNPETQIFTYIVYAPKGKENPYSNQVVYKAIDNNNYGLPQYNQSYYCKISFIIRDNIVSSYNFNGDNCVADILDNVSD